MPCSKEKKNTLALIIRTIGSSLILLGLILFANNSLLIIGIFKIFFILLNSVSAMMMILLQEKKQMRFISKLFYFLIFNSFHSNANFYLSNRLSYALGLCGPSFTVDTACSSSAYALDCAYKYIMSGACDAAIVGGSQLVLNLKTTIEYSR